MRSLVPKVLGLSCCTLWLAATAQGQTSCTLNPNDLPVAQSAVQGTSGDRPYFSYKGKTVALVGISHEYLCHISQPTRQSQYCTLESYPSIFSDLQTKKNNVIRLWAVFNHSPGRAYNGTPFLNEQPFKWNGTKWDLNVQASADITATNLNPAYFTNLEAVVLAAYCKGIIVELTLLDPWDGDWTTGPFSSGNTVSGQGFSQQRLFLSFENLAGKTDTSVANLFARNAQKVAVATVVSRLKKYPNVIWEIANESDFTPSGAGITPANVVDLENSIVGVIQANDNPLPNQHLIMVNGHQAGAFAWSVPGAVIENAHYTKISDTRYGGLELLLEPTLKASRHGYAIAFNENKGVGVGAPLNFPDADDVRSEAWEFAFSGGGLFDAYSVDRGNTFADPITTQLGVLGDFLRNDSGIIPAARITHLGSMQQASCNLSGDWCQGLPARESSSNACAADSLTYWAALKSTSELALYLHHGVLTNLPGNTGNPFLRYDARPCDPGFSYPSLALRVQVPQTGCWTVSWIEPQNGMVRTSSTSNMDQTKTYLLSSPSYRHDIVLLVSLFRAGSCT